MYSCPHNNSVLCEVYPEYCSQCECFPQHLKSGYQVLAEGELRLMRWPNHSGYIWLVAVSVIDGSITPIVDTGFRQEKDALKAIVDSFYEVMES